MANDDIVQNIVLAGDTEVIAGLAAIGIAGKAAFSAIRDAASNTGFQSFTGGLLGVSAALSGLVGGMFAFTEATSNSVVQQQFLATAMGTTLDKLGGFTLAINSFVGDTDSLTSAMKRLSVRVEQDWPIIQKSVRNAADLYQQDALRIKEANLALEKSSINLSFQQQEAAQLSISNQLKVENAELSLQEARARRASLTGQPDRFDQQRFNDRRKQLDVESAELELSRAQEEQTKAIAEAENKRKQAVEERQLRQLQLNEAIRKQAETQANDVTKLKKYVDDTIAGIPTSASKVQLSSENIVKGIIASTKGGINALEGFKGSLGEIGSAAPAEFEVLKKLADYFHAARDETQKTAVAISFFGRGVQPSFIRALSEGSAELEKERKRLEDLGFGFTTIQQRGEKSEEFITYRFARALARLGNDVSRVGQQMGETFAPGFTRVLDDIANYIEKNRAGFVKWAQSLADTVIPVVESVVRVLTGVPDKAKDQWLLDYIANIEGFGKTVNKVINGIVLPAFHALVGVGDIVADTINKATGGWTKLTGVDVIVGAWALRMLGIFSLLRIGLGAIIATLGLFISGGLTAAITTGATAVIAAISAPAVAIGTALAAGIVAGILLVPLAEKIAVWIQDELGKLESWLKDKFSSGGAALPDVKTLNENRERKRRGLPPLEATPQTSGGGTEPSTPEGGPPGHHEDEAEWTERIRKEDEAAAQQKKTADAHKELADASKDAAKAIEELMKQSQKAADAAQMDASKAVSAAVVKQSQAAQAASVPPAAQDTVAPAVMAIRHPPGSEGIPIDQPSGLEDAAGNPVIFKGVPQPASGSGLPHYIDYGDANEETKGKRSSRRRRHPRDLEQYRRDHGGLEPEDYKATGGPIYGSGHGTSDSVPIMASHGEFMVAADGSNLMQAVAHFHGHQMAEGGEVGDATEALASIGHMNPAEALNPMPGLPGMAAPRPSIKEVTPKEWSDPASVFNQTPNSKVGAQRLFEIEHGGEKGFVMAHTEGNQLYIDQVEMGGSKVPGGIPNLIGPSATRAIGRLLREQFPGTKIATGERVSGARAKAWSDRYEKAKAEADRKGLNYFDATKYAKDAADKGASPMPNTPLEGMAEGGFVPQHETHPPKTSGHPGRIHVRVSELMRAAQGTHNILGSVSRMGMAAGGLISGAGTGTSDSIPMMAPMGSYIVKANGGNLASAIHHFGRGAAKMSSGRGYALGGLVGGMSDSPMARYADGGMVNGGSGGMGHLGTVDLRTDYGVVRVYADQSALETIKKAAISKQTMSTGPKPAWYGGSR
jgi:hypothetical protein